MANYLMQEEAGGGLLVKLDKSKAGVPQTAAAVAARWFAQDMFADPSLAEEAPEELHASAAAAGAAFNPQKYLRTRKMGSVLSVCWLCERAFALRLSRWNISFMSKHTGPHMTSRIGCLLCAPCLCWRSTLGHVNINQSSQFAVQP